MSEDQQKESDTNTAFDYSNVFKPREYTPQWYQELIGKAIRDDSATWFRSTNRSRFPNNRSYETTYQTDKTNLVLSVIDGSPTPLTAMEIAKGCGFKGSAKVRDSLMAMIDNKSIIKGNAELSAHKHTFIRSI